jgi:hypothetical protein
MLAAMALWLRPIVECDYPFVAEVANLMWPEFPVNAEDVRAEHGGSAINATFGKYIVMDLCERVAFATWLEGHGPTADRLARLGVHISPQDPRVGEVITLLETEAMAQGFQEALLYCRSDHQLKLVSLKTLGYAEVEQDKFSILNIEQFDFEPFRLKIAELEASGIRIIDVGQLIREKLEWLHPLHEATNEMAADIPSNLGTSPWSYEKFESFITDQRQVDPKLMIVALEGSRIVSFTRLQQSTVDPTCSRTGFSGTVRSHRRRGLVTAVKAKCIRTAHEIGIRQILTDNSETNPMLLVNQRLGFAPVFTLTLFHKRLGRT